MSCSARAVLFDLDDTLYPQRRFVISGFAAVARHLQCVYGLDPRRVFLVLRAAWRERRGLELQACVAHFALPTALVPALVEVIRGHQPAVRLPRRSTRTLLELRRTLRTGVVTNGSPAIQARKVEALGLRALVDTIVFAGEHGTGRGKPEAAGFSAALARLGVRPDRAVFVGNDEACDIAGARGRWDANVTAGTVIRAEAGSHLLRAAADDPRRCGRGYDCRRSPGRGIAHGVLMIVGRHRIGRGEPLFVIAEIGLNHGGSLDRALALVDAAADAGRVCGQAADGHRLRAGRAVTRLRDFFAAFELDEPAHHAIAARARSHGLALISTPLSEGAVDVLERVGVDAYKVASGDLTWTQLIERCARTGKPVIISTGACHAGRGGARARRRAAQRRRRCRAAALRLVVPGAGRERKSPRHHDPG